MKLRPWQWITLVICVAVCAAVLYRDHQVTQGREAFNRLGCPTCHGAGGAPSLEHVGSKYDRKTFVRFISDPETIYAQRDNKPLNSGYLTMPRLSASHRDIEALSYFLSAQQ